MDIGTSAVFSDDRYRRPYREEPPFCCANDAHLSDRGWPGNRDDDQLRRAPRAGGFGTVITEGIYTGQTFSQGYVHQPGMTDEAQAKAWRPAVSGIKAPGALAIAQLMHAGALSQGNRFRDGTVGPSAIQPSR